MGGGREGPRESPLKVAKNEVEIDGVMFSQWLCACGYVFLGLFGVSLVRVGDVSTIANGNWQWTWRHFVDS